MTISKLIRELIKLKEKHGASVQVVIDKRGNDNWSRGAAFTHASVQDVRKNYILWADENGNVCRKDGSERWKKVIVLNGE